MDLSRLLPSATTLTDALAALPDAVAGGLVAAAVTLVLIALVAPRRAPRVPAAVLPGSADGDCVFLIEGSSLRPETAAARAMLDGLGRGPRLGALTALLSRDAPSIQKDIEALVLYGTAFRHHVARREGGVLEIAGEPRGGAAVLALRPASEDARALAEARRDLEAAGAEARFLREVLDRAPFLAWTLGPDGHVSWANATYRQRFDDPAEGLPDHRLHDAFLHTLEEVPLTAGPSGGLRRRVAVARRQEADPDWFEISQVRGAEGATLGYATPADDLVAAEASLRRFVETLTETFAHLPIGLAVFDKNRRLGLFNPALTDLVKIDAVWLAARPSLRDFLERLRETRQMPEQKDFAAFRRMLTELEKGAREGTYEENWVLPSGKIFRVTGRPHPQGALAFLFEDISTAIMLERRYRGELELSQATLDRLSEAVAVFDTSGMLVFVNSAFESIWGLDPMAGLDGPGVAEMTALWQERCAPSPAWAQLRDYATGAETRTSWTAAVETRDGRPLELLAAPLPNGSTLVVFRDISDERERVAEARRSMQGALSALRQAALLDDLALGHLQLPAETALAQLQAAVRSAPNPEAFQSLTAAAQAVKEGLARSRDLQAAAQAELAGAGEHGAPQSGLCEALGPLLKARGLALALVEDGATGAGLPDGPVLRRLAWSLLLAAAERAGKGATVELACLRDGARARITATAPAAPAAADCTPSGVSLALARRVVETLGGSLEASRPGESARVTVAAEIALDRLERPGPLLPRTDRRARSA
jgi:PAS domain-containing protein